MRIFEWTNLTRMKMAVLLHDTAFKFFLNFLFFSINLARGLDLDRIATRPGVVGRGTRDDLLHSALWYGKRC